jgi:hypothetical protein
VETDGLNSLNAPKLIGSGDKRLQFAAAQGTIAS